MRAVTKISTPQIVTCLAGGNRWELRHPEFLGSTVTCPCMTVGCRALVCAAGAGQQEDIDALPAEELAAIMCALMASDCEPWAGWDGVIDAIGRPARVLAENAWYAAGDVGSRERWMVGEQLIRNGEVR